ncbi:MSMEG_0567/Sll0786 family nitrogen starvation N-acetyltransferase [Marinoscillum sp. MHG1-6]|uniref:MSMEG_0567/Sll0786 family nitrogen starvation N-acetyltransferase n=1 Tax=Marinoscillum sp. MHG1-6 TaxID=2959627 RepID=UPI0021571424|nr:MSMEG_0567/Sll0786 family nitrogen starvation N-acetyltransferase [Marinoscillum sp. MHG1-6]
MLLEPYKKHPSRYLKFDFAEQLWQRRSYWELRKNVFCEEQRLFVGTDKDLFDTTAIPIIASCYCMGMEDRVVGAVRIYQREPGIWFGGRLAVDKEFRSLSRFQTLNLFPDNKTIHPFTLAVGGALIYKAVSTATALGCRQFLAHVQPQNVRFFERMHWKTIGTINKNGIQHAVMEASLNYFQEVHSTPRDLKSA